MDSSIMVSLYCSAAITWDTPAALISKTSDASATQSQHPMQLALIAGFLPLSDEWGLIPEFIKIIYLVEWNISILLKNNKNARKCVLFGNYFSLCWAWHFRNSNYGSIGPWEFFSYCCHSMFFWRFLWPIKWESRFFRSIRKYSLSSLLYCSVLVIGKRGNGHIWIVMIGLFFDMSRRSWLFRSCKRFLSLIYSGEGGMISNFFSPFCFLNTRFYFCPNRSFRTSAYLSFLRLGRLSWASWCVSFFANKYYFFSVFLRIFRAGLSVGAFLSIRALRAHECIDFRVYSMARILRHSLSWPISGLWFGIFGGVHIITLFPVFGFSSFSVWYSSRTHAALLSA